MTAIKTALKEIKEIEDIRWVIYSLSSMMVIENNREKHPILNLIYNILTELHNQRKQLTLCKVLAHTGINENEEADKVAKQAIDMPWMTTTRL